jgi:hypothetical protein
MKSVNGSILDSTKDMGHDGDPAIAIPSFINFALIFLALRY